MRVLISENQPGELDALADGLNSSGSVQVVALTRDGLETAQMIAKLRPHVALVRGPLAGMDGFHVCRVSVLAAPETLCVVVLDTPEEEAQFRTDAMRAGARGITHLGVPPADLLRLIEDLVKVAPRPEDEELRLVTDPSRMPVTISVTGAKGGIGKTTVATNLALALNQQYPDQVVLVDFLGQYGDVKLLLDLQSGGTLLDLAAYEEVDRELLQARLTRHESGLHVLGGVNGPRTLEALGHLSLGQVAQILGCLRRSFRVIVVDLPPLAQPHSRYLFQRSDWVTVLTTLTDLATIRNTSALLDGLAGGLVPVDKIRLVVNRFEPGNPFGVADLEQAAKHPVSLRLPEAAETVTAALNTGVPFLLGKPQAPLSRALRDLADLLMRETPRGNSPAPSPAASSRHPATVVGR